VIGFIAFSFRRAWQGFWRNAVMSIAATATMVLMLLLLAGFWIILTGLNAGVEYVEERVDLVVDIEEWASPTRVDEIIADALAMPEVADVEFISKEEALRRFREARTAQGEQDLTRFLESNPLPASLEISLVSPGDYRLVADRLRPEAGISAIKNIGDLVERLRAVTDFLRAAGWIVLAGVALIVLFIVINTVRLAVVARADEIEIMRLVGASDAFIRWPFVFEGAMVGLLGALITLVLLAAAAEPLTDFMYDFFRVLPLRAETLSRDLTVLVSATGLGLGILGAYMSVRTYLAR
jgi:cell division transport system permease protein